MASPLMERPGLLAGIGGAVAALAVLLSFLLDDGAGDDPPADGRASVASTTAEPKSSGQWSIGGGGKEASAGGDGDKTALAVAPAGGTEPSTAAGPNPGKPDETAAAAAGAVAALAPAPASVSGEVRPTFDVVRIDRSGDAVMAGRAAPGQEVVIRDGDKPLGEVRADDRGEWVFIPETALAPGGRTLSVVPKVAGDASPPAPAEQGGLVVLVVPRPTQGQGPVVAIRPGQPDAPARILQGPGQVATRSARLGPDSAGATVADGVPTAGITQDLAIATVDHGQEGRIGMTGRAVPGATVRLYLDDQPLGSATADATGAWGLKVPAELPDGPSTLRADLMTKSGEISQRVVVPWLPVLDSEKIEPGSVVVIRKGYSLWRVAQNVYGRGIGYVDIYAANRDQIRDPDLIYPGQVFSLPPRLEGERGR